MAERHLASWSSDYCGATVAAAATSRRKSMSKDAVVKMGILSPADTPNVSTILEEIVQFFDGWVQFRFTTCKLMPKHIRLRLALTVLGETGYARLDEAAKPRPMVVPTPKLLRPLNLKNLTTDVDRCHCRLLRVACLSQIPRGNVTMFAPSSR
jgi:hypothetical protein